MADYSRRIRQINSRYNPDNNLLVEERSYSTVKGIDGDLRKYIKLAMNEVDSEYTAKTIEAGNRAKDHLQAEQKGKRSGRNAKLSLFSYFQYKYS